MLSHRFKQNKESGIRSKGGIERYHLTDGKQIPFYHLLTKKKEVWNLLKRNSLDYSHHHFADLVVGSSNFVVKLHEILRK